MEAAGLGFFMLSACLFVALLEHPASPVRQAIESAFLRRALIGLAMGLTAIAIIYSPWGKQSGAHINPSVTLTFYRLGKVAREDALFYVAAQFAGGLAGVLLAVLLLRDAIAVPAVAYAVTVPGGAGTGAAFLAEVLISFGLMTVVLVTSNHPRLGRFTGLCAGVLVATYITVEAPLSGMSMNPARTVASALPAGVWTSAWIYFAAPPLGMLLAAEAYVRVNGILAVQCAKLDHDDRKRCIFCQYQHGEDATPRGTSLRAAPARAA
jgi:aquaporin Z